MIAEFSSGSEARVLQRSMSNGHSDSIESVSVEDDVIRSRRTWTALEQLPRFWQQGLGKAEFHVARRSA